jgi:hypothetical protein
MLAVAMLCGTMIRYTRLLVHIAVGDCAISVEEGGESSSPSSHGVVDLV